MGEELTTQPAVQTLRLCRWKVPSPPCIGNCEHTHVRPRQTKSFGSRYARLLGFRWGSRPRCHGALHVRRVSHSGPRALPGAAPRKVPGGAKFCGAEAEASPLQLSEESQIESAAKKLREVHRP